MPTHKKADRTGLAHAPLQLHALPQLGLGRLEVLLHLGGHLLAHAALDCDLLRLGGEQPLLQRHNLRRQTRRAKQCEGVRGGKARGGEGG